MGGTGELGSKPGSGQSGKIEMSRAVYEFAEDGCQQLCAPLVVLFVVPAEVFTHCVLMFIFLVYPCLFASRAFELMSAQFLPLILM